MERLLLEEIPTEKYNERLAKLNEHIRVGIGNIVRSRAFPKETKQEKSDL